MSELNGLEKFAKRWQVILGAAFAAIAFIAGVVSWKNSLAKASAVEGNTQRLGVVERAVVDLVDAQKQHQHQHDVDQQQHDAELRWISDHLIRIEGAVNGIAKTQRQDR